MAIRKDANLRKTALVGQPEARKQADVQCSFLLR
jgi:hypothetical protein